LLEGKVLKGEKLKRGRKDWDLRNGKKILKNGKRENPVECLEVNN